MKLKHTLLLGLLVQGLDGSISLPAQAQSQWDYIVNAADGTLYFGKDIKTYDGITFMKTKIEADPEGGNGDGKAWIQPYRCDQKTFKGTDGNWHPISPNTVGEQLMKFACKDVRTISDNNTSRA